MEDSTPIDRNNHQSIDRSVNSYGNDGNSIRSYNWSTNNNSSINDTNSVNKVDDNRLSEELRGLLDHQKEIKKWLSLVEAKIFKAETRYLEDTPLGNIIKGWDSDSIRVGTNVNKKLTEEKERLFSYSSYKKYELYKKQQEENLNNKKSNLLLHKETKQMVPTKKFQKNKKRKSTSDLLDSNSYSNSTIMNSNGSGRDSASIVSDLDGRRSVDFTDASSRK